MLNLMGSLLARFLPGDFLTLPAHKSRLQKLHVGSYDLNGRKVAELWDGSNNQETSGMQTGPRT
jgi:hypothetical protein